MSSISDALRNAQWRKTVMAITGLFWMGFVLMHMAGNILVFAGPEAYNRYSHLLISNPLLPLAEISLVIFLLLHAYSGLTLWIENRKAKPKGYAVAPKGAKALPVASRTMIFTGAFLAAFLAFHIATFKYGNKSFVIYDGFQMHDLYSLVATAFKHPGYVAWYLLSLFLIGVHLFHGFASVFQTLGFYHPRYTPLIKIFGIIYAVVVASGFAALPIYFKFLA